MISMNRPSRAARESATTTRYAGFFVVPVRLSRMCTATGHLTSLLVATRRSSRQEGEGAALALELAEPPFHVLEPLHHLLDLRVLLEEPIHVGDLGAAAARDAQAAAAVDDRGGQPLPGRHRGDDRLELLELALLAL